jgi:hypothetical protein
MKFWEFLTTPIGPHDPNRMKWGTPFLVELRLFRDWGPRLLACGIFAWGLLAAVGALGVLMEGFTPLVIIAVMLIGFFFIVPLSLVVVLAHGDQFWGDVVIDAKGITHSWTDVALGWISLSSQHWQFAEITECVLVPRQSLKRLFSVLVVRTASTADMIAVPRHVDLQRIQQLLQLRGVRVVVQQALPEELLPDQSLLSPRNRARFGLAAVALVLFVVVIVAVPSSERYRKRWADDPRPVAGDQAAQAVMAAPRARLPEADSVDSPLSVPPRTATSPLSNGAEVRPPGLIREFEIVGGHSSGLAVSADGRRVFALGREVNIWDEAQDQEATVYAQHDQRIAAISVATENSRVMTLARDTVHVWDASTLETILVFKLDLSSRTMALSPDGRRAVIADAGRNVHVWDVDTQSQLLVFSLPTLSLSALAISQNGRFVFGTDGSQIGYWNLETGEEGKLTVISSRGRYTTFALPRDGVAILAGPPGVLAWDMRAAEPAQGIAISGRVQAAAVTPDGRRGFLAQQKEVIVWDFQQAKEIGRFQADMFLVAELAVSPDGRRLATRLGSKLRLWDVEAAL